MMLDVWIGSYNTILKCTSMSTESMSRLLSFSESIVLDASAGLYIPTPNCVSKTNLNFTNVSFTVFYFYLILHAAIPKNDEVSSSLINSLLLIYTHTWVRGVRSWSN